MVIKPELQAYYKIIGKNVLKARKANGMSQHDLATLCNVDRAKISKIENGREDYMFSTLLDLSIALEINIATLMTG